MSPFLQDRDGNPRRVALQTLAEKWPDETTRALLAERAFVDGHVASIFGGQHSYSGRIAMTRDCDGVAPYLDPRKPISRKHIERTAKQANVPTDKIDEAVHSLSKYLGWDIMKGSQSKRIEG